MAQRFSGVFTALVTPFTSTDELDVDALSELLARQRADGIDGVVVAGSTGESACLSIDEKKALVKIAKAHTSLPIIAGAGSNCTKDAASGHQIMADAGADATLQVVPYYNKPTQSGLFAHFSHIAKSSSLPVIIYNVPSRTGIDIAPQTLADLACAHENIVGIKDANADMERMGVLLHKVKSVRPDFVVLTGEDGAFLPFLSLGGDGVISVVSHIAAYEFLAIYRAAKNGDLMYAQKIALKLSGLYKLMFSYPNPIPVKTVLALIGTMEKNFRLPLCPMSAPDEEKLVQELREFSFLKSFKDQRFFQ